MEKIKKELKCPHCGSLNVVEGDCYDTELAFDNKKEKYVILRKMDGHCLNCERDNLLWEEVFEFVGYQNIMLDE